MIPGGYVMGITQKMTLGIFESKKHPSNETHTMPTSKVVSFF